MFKEFSGSIQRLQDLSFVNFNILLVLVFVYCLDHHYEIHNNRKHASTINNFLLS